MPPKRPREPLSAEELASQSALEASLFGTASYKARPKPVSTKQKEIDTAPDEQLFSLDVGSDDDDDDDDDNHSQRANQSEAESDRVSAPQQPNAESETDYEQDDSEAEFNPEEEEADLESDSDTEEKAHVDGKPVWSDPDDKRLTVPLAGAGARAADGSLAGTQKLRKLRLFPGEERVNGEE